MRTLVLGGARSGKSVFAEELAGPDNVIYVATARPWAGDTDFAERIAVHAARRPNNWVTEDERDVEKLLLENPQKTMLIDDIGTWLTHATDNCGQGAWENDDSQLNQKMTELVSRIQHYQGGDLVIVSPEVGLSVIPAHKSGRVFRDRIGTLNQELARVCDRVVLVVAGIPLELKGI